VAGGCGGCGDAAGPAPTALLTSPRTRALARTSGDCNNNNFVQQLGRELLGQLTLAAKGAQLVMSLDQWRNTPARRAKVMPASKQTARVPVPRRQRAIVTLESVVMRRRRLPFHPMGSPNLSFV